MHSLRTPTRALLATALLAACGCAGDDSGGRHASETPQSVAAKMLAAHGGREAWEALETVRVARSHHLTGRPQPWDYAIHAEYGSERLVMDWNDPPGRLVWDGERAWSVDWAPAGVILPRFAMGIGFYAINLPYFIDGPDARLVSLERRTGQAPGDTREYWVLGVEFEGRPSRRPPGVAAARDRTDVFIDPETFRVAGTHFHWRYAAQLDVRGLGESDFFQNYVVHDYVERRGILWPSTYTIYDREGNETTTGRYFDYRFDEPLDPAVFRADGVEGVVFDTSSSYLRAGAS